MASISTESNGRKVVQVVCPDGIRRSIRLGAADDATAKVAASWIQSIADAMNRGESIDRRAASWLANQSDRLHDRIARAGLADPRRSKTISKLGDVAKDYIARRTDIEPSSVQNFEKAKANLVEFFGADQDVSKITPARADDFKRWLLGEKAYSRATVCQRIKRVKTIFRDAVRRHLLAANPFAEVTAGSDANAENDAFVERAVVDRVIEQATDVWWKLLIALSRYGGLRIPSEIESLRWQDVLWDTRRIVIHAKKTKKHDDGGVRVMPLFTELEPFLRDAFEAAADGAEFVFPDAMRLHTNPGTTFRKFIKRAGVKPWPRQFHNLRASRQTELADLVGEHVTSEWLGNDVKTARRHYLRVTDEHFERVLKKGDPKSGAQPGAHSGAVTSPQESAGLLTGSGFGANNTVLTSGDDSGQLVVSQPPQFNGPRGT